MQEKGISYAELSKKSGITSSSLQRYFAGGTKKIPFDAIEAISPVLGVTPTYLLGWERDKRDIPKTIKIPVLGVVPAGVPVEAVEDILDYEEIPLDWTKHGDYFALRISGDSMIPVICDGDTVIVKKTSEVQNGDTVIAMVNGYDSTCKKFKRTEEGIMLIPNNESYDPMFYSTKKIKDLPIHILGKVVELRRKF
ncbi:MAG: LexA family protein [Bacillota bacterium]